MGGGLAGEAATRTAEALPSSRSGSDTARRTGGTGAARGAADTGVRSRGVAKRRARVGPRSECVRVRFPPTAWDAVCGGWARGVTDGRCGCRGVGVVGPGPRWWHGVRIAAAGRGPKGARPWSAWPRPRRGASGAGGAVGGGAAAWQGCGALSCRWRGRRGARCRQSRWCYLLVLDAAPGARGPRWARDTGRPAARWGLAPDSWVRRTPSRSGLDQLRFPPKMD